MSFATPVARPDEGKLCHERLRRVFEAGGLPALDDYAASGELTDLELTILRDLRRSLEGN